MLLGGVMQIRVFKMRLFLLIVDPLGGDVEVGMIPTGVSSRLLLLIFFLIDRIWRELFLHRH